MTASTLEPLKFAPLPEPLRARIEAELAPGERLLWASQPDLDCPKGPKRSDTSFGVWMIAWFLLGLYCLGMVLLGQPRRPEGGQLPLFFVGVIAEVIAFLMAVSYVAAYVRMGPRRQHLHLHLYALTDRRALIWEPDRSSAAVRVRQYPAGSLPPSEVERLEFPDGSGSICLGPRRDPDEGFHNIWDARVVDTLVRRILVDSSPAPKINSDFDSDNPEEPF